MPAGQGWRKTEASGDPAPARHVLTTRMLRLKQVFSSNIETCEHYGGAVKVIASIGDPTLTNKEPGTP